jgi:predicted dehydrogenase
MSRLPVAVIGVGHLGKEHARILASLPDVDLVGVVDPNRTQAESVATRTGTTAYADARPLLGRIKAAVIAAPTGHHHAAASELLKHGISLLVEKPLASTSAQGADLVALAAKHGATLQVGHIERFNPAFEELRRRPMVPRYIRCDRYGGFTGRSTDVGVVLDVMIHDLDLVLDLVAQPVERVEALGATVLGGNEDMAQARVTFAGGCVADLSACRISPEPARTMRVWGAEGYAGVDFAARKLTLMQPGEALRSGRIDSRRLTPDVIGMLKAEMFSRFVETITVDCTGHHQADQLTRELIDFVACVREGRTPRVDGAAGLSALDLAGRVVQAIGQRDARPTGRLFASGPVSEAA